MSDRKRVARQNRDWIRLFEDHSDHIEDIIDYLLKNELKMTADERKRMHEAMYCAHECLAIDKEIMDKRRVCLTVTQQYPVALAFEYAYDAAAKQYIRFVKSLQAYLLKKGLEGMKKLVESRIEYVQPEPMTFTEAIFDGYIGAQCPSCAGWRVKRGRAFGTAFCFKCWKSFKFREPSPNQQLKKNTPTKLTKQVLEEIKTIMSSA